MSRSENLTIIIPTKNRPNWIKRCLMYYSKTNFSGEILLADSSDEYNINEFSKNLKKNFSFKNHKFFSRVKFISCKGLKGAPSILRALYKVKTKYVVIVSDDDIIITPKLHIGLNFLEKNKNYSGFTGKALSIKTKNSLPFCSDVLIVNEELIRSEEQSPLDRCVSYLANPTCAVFTVTSKSLAIRAYLQVNSLDSTYLRSYVFGELIYTLIICREGKIKSFNFGFCVRQSHDNQFYNKFNFYNFISDNSLSKIMRFVNNFLLTQKKKEKNNSINLDLILNKFYRKIFINFLISEPQSKNKFFSLIKNLLPKKILFELQKIYHKKNSLEPEMQCYVNFVRSKQ